MKNSFFSLLLLSFPILIACSQKSSPEEEAAKLLNDARVLLQQSEFTKAKGCIDSLRSNYPTALNAREDAILLLDSICKEEATQELADFEKIVANSDPNDRIAQDTIQFMYDGIKKKVEFFEKKLKFDTQRHQKH